MPFLLFPFYFLLLPSFRFHFRLRQNRPHLENRNHRQKADEQKQQRQEKSNRADEHRPIPLRRLIESPRRWQKIAVQTGHDNYKSLQPHADADDQRDKPEQQKLRSNLLKPQQLRRDSVAQNQRPV